MLLINKRGNIFSDVFCGNGVNRGRAVRGNTIITEEAVLLNELLTLSGGRGSSEGSVENSLFMRNQSNTVVLLVINVSPRETDLSVILLLNISHEVL